MADYRTSGITNADGTVNLGLKNNNPGDIKYDGTSWQGMVGNDGTFVTFADTTWGLRALATDLATKINSDGLNTITEIITAYAPASDGNDVASYIAAVSTDAGFDPNQVLTADPGTLQLLVRAIVDHELSTNLSTQYISDSDISQGIAMMGSIAAAAQAAVIYAQQNPLTVALVVLGIAGILYYVTKDD